MARERATINVGIWQDDDFRALSGAAQGLYFKLLTHAELSYCGVADFRPGRLAATTGDGTADGVMHAAQELSDTHFIVIDQETEEVLVRSFMRWDGLLKQPKLVVSAAKAFGAVASPKLRAVIVHELRRLKREMPESTSWAHLDMAAVLKQNAKPAAEFDTALEWVYGVPLAHRQSQRHGQAQGLAAGAATGTRTTATSTTTSTFANAHDELSTAENESFYPEAVVA